MLGNPGVREVLEACGFASAEDGARLELVRPPSEPAVGVLLRAAAEKVHGAQQMLQELDWLHATQQAVHAHSKSLVPLPVIVQPSETATYRCRGAGARA